MNDPDDHELAEQLRALRPRAVSQEFAGRIAERLEAESLMSRRRVRRNLLLIGGAAAAAILFVTSIILWPEQPGAPLGGGPAQRQLAPAGDESDSLNWLPTYAVLRHALAESPERLMALLDEQSPVPRGTPSKVWTFLDHDLALEEETL